MSTVVNPKKTTIIELETFNLKTIFRNSVVVFVGRRRTGKSNAMLNIAYYFRWFPYFLCMSATDALNGDWSYRMPFSFVKSGWDSDMIRKLLMSRMRLKWINRNNPNFVLEPIMIILEDLMYDNSTVMNDKWFKYLLNNGRHLEICLLLTVQYIYQMSRVCRTNVDFLFACSEKNLGNRKRLYTEFGASMPFEVFDEIFKRVTSNYGMMVFDVNAMDYDVTRSMFRWKAYRMMKTDHWRLGSDAYWKKHEEFVKLYGDKMTPFEGMDDDEDFHKTSAKRGRKRKLSERESQELNVELDSAPTTQQNEDVVLDDDGNVIGGSEAQMVNFVIPPSASRSRAKRETPIGVKFV